MKNFLVPVDGSEGSKRALHYAKERSRNEEVRIHVLHVEAPLRYEELRVYASRKEFHELRHQACKRLLAEAVEVLEKDRVPHETHIQEGEAAQTIARFVEAQKMDEVIMGTRGMGAFGQMLLGSVAQRVVHLVHVPVTLVK
jgi:nucleotide-binding universal stress UspA family protein